MLVTSTGVLNPKSLRDLVNMFGMAEVVHMTGLPTWMIAKIIDIRTEIFK